MNFDNLKKMVDDKFISVQKHPTEDLYIYNYTNKGNKIGQMFLNNSIKICEDKRNIKILKQNNININNDGCECISFKTSLTFSNNTLNFV